MRGESFSAAAQLSMCDFVVLACENGVALSLLDTIFAVAKDAGTQCYDKTEQKRMGDPSFIVRESEAVLKVPATILYPEVDDEPELAKHRSRAVTLRLTRKTSSVIVDTLRGIQKEIGNRVKALCDGYKEFLSSGRTPTFQLPCLAIVAAHFRPEPYYCDGELKPIYVASGKPIVLSAAERIALFQIVEGLGTLAEAAPRITIPIERFLAGRFPSDDIWTSAGAADDSWTSA